jgi:hypothetical protein
MAKNQNESMLEASTNALKKGVETATDAMQNALENASDATQVLADRIQKRTEDHNK